MKMDKMENLLLNAEWPEPGVDVRARVLAAALPLVKSQSSRLDCMWFSPKWRMLAMLAILILAVVDAVSVHINVWAPAEQNGVARDTVRVVEMAAREAGLTPADTSALVAQAIAATRPQSLASMNMDTLFQRSN
jgi:hypothetical protein